MERCSGRGAKEQRSSRRCVRPRAPTASRGHTPKCARCVHGVREDQAGARGREPAGAMKQKTVPRLSLGMRESWTGTGPNGACGLGAPATWRTTGRWDRGRRRGGGNNSSSSSSSSTLPSPAGASPWPGRPEAGLPWEPGHWVCGVISLTQCRAETENSSRAGRGEKSREVPLEPSEILGTRPRRPSLAGSRSKAPGRGEKGESDLVSF